MSAPSVDWVEVGPRDGLQSWASPVSTPAKVGLIAGLLDCGLRRVEATSMVHPKWVPQLADADAVLEAPTSDAPSRRSEEHTSELQSRFDLVCRLLLEKKKTTSSAIASKTRS